jgi:predicted AAA+ superfamily ATPase
LFSLYKIWPYGAGKSTVIQSYLKTHLNREFINVSLADFSLSGKSDEAPLEITVLFPAP